MSYLKNKLEEIRNYPETTRRQILIFSTSGITLFIMFLWLVNIWLINNKPVKEETNENFATNLKEEVSKIGTGINLLKKTVANQF